jgi:aldose 1-epimerase
VIAMRYEFWMFVFACAALAITGCEQSKPVTKKSFTTSETNAPSKMTEPVPLVEETKDEKAPTEAPKTEDKPDNVKAESKPESTPMPAKEAPITEPSKLETTTKESDKTMGITKTAFGKNKAGNEVSLFTCQNKNGLILKLTDYGATVVSVETPDKSGKQANITLSFPTIEGYVERHPYFGSTVGRYCNRIANGKFKIGEHEYTLATNNGPNHLHGGNIGFDAVMWQAEEIKTDAAVGIKFSYTSADGEEGYPGKVDVKVSYLLSNANELTIEYEATTDKDTVVNLTNHNYWNLGGAGSGQILKHELMLNCDQYLTTDETSIPTGKLENVAETPFDFRTSHAIGDQIDKVKEAPYTTKGYDHCYVVNGEDGKLRLAAKVKDPASGRTMEIHTTEPGIQLYCGNFLDGSDSNGGFKQHEAFCLETQHYPDSPNQPDFPTTLLKSGETYRSTTVHKFGVDK